MQLIRFMLTNSPFKFCSKNIKNQYQDFSKTAKNSQHYQRKFFFFLPLIIVSLKQILSLKAQGNI